MPSKVDARRSWRFFVYLFVGLLSALQLGSQSTNATVSFSDIPEWGADGDLAGYVYGTDSSKVNLFLFEFIPDLGWYAMSGCKPVQIQGTGQFKISATTTIADRYAVRYSAYLLPASLSVPCVQAAASLPFAVERNFVGRATLPRLPAYKTLSFGGLEWNIKSAPVKVYPGPQFFIEDNAYVDALGQLHLKITKCADSWCAAEIFTKDAVGYGTYTFTLNSAVNNLDPNVTLGLFTWDGQAGDQSNREWDIEFGRWGNPSAPANAQYVVQPYNGPNNISRFLMSPSPNTTHTVTWLPGQVRFASTAAAALGSTPVSQWTYPSGSLPVPRPGDAHLHLNLYIGAGTSPRTAVGQEVIISRVQYAPAGSQLGFSRPSDSVGFLAANHTVAIAGDGLDCFGAVEADRPWISVGGPSQIQAGGLVRYSVADNVGSIRIGHLVLRADSCNTTLGQQVLTVMQDGLVCSPSFETASSHVGFLQSVRSVIVRGTSSACSWAVTSSAPWLQIVSPRTGAGDGVVQFSATPNLEEDLRQGRLTLDNGRQHLVFQDASGAALAISPLSVSACGPEPPEFSAAWVAPGNVELRLHSPTGLLVGQFGSSGTSVLPRIADGTLIYLLDASGSGKVLATTRATVKTTDCDAAGVNPAGVINSASYSAVSVAPASLAGVFGRNLSKTIAQTSPGVFAANLGGVSVTLGGEPAQLSYVSPGQINFLAPSGLPPGRHILAVGNATAEVIVTNVAPGIFTISGDGRGVAYASVLGIAKDGLQTSLPPYQCGATGCYGVPVTIPDDLAELHLVLYGTGLRGVRQVSAEVGPLAAEVVFVGPQSQFPGLDQVNLRLKTFAGLRGKQFVRVYTDGVSANPVEIEFR